MFDGTFVDSTIDELQRLILWHINRDAELRNEVAKLIADKCKDDGITLLVNLITADANERD